MRCYSSVQHFISASPRNARNALRRNFKCRIREWKGALESFYFKSIKLSSKARLTTQVGKRLVPFKCKSILRENLKVVKKKHGISQYISMCRISTFAAYRLNLIAMQDEEISIKMLPSISMLEILDDKIALMILFCI